MEERVVAAAAVEGIGRGVARQRVGARAARDVLDAGDGGEARGRAGAEVHRHIRGRPGIGQRVDAVEKIGIDHLDVCQRAASNWSTLCR